MTAEELITRYLEVATPVKPKKPRKKSLAQKQGARQGGRTRSRHLSVESKGFLYYEYYARATRNSTHSDKKRNK